MTGEAGGVLLDQAFLSSASQYKQALATAATSDAFRALWRNTSLPYSMTAADPYSAAYVSEVKAVYRGLTALDYDVGSELTSTKQDDAQFQLGYPWTSGDLGVIASEMSKAVQALRALGQVKAANRVIEFGAGWGNLALPLAKAGFAVTTVDIDAGFNRRIERLAREQHTTIETFEGTFIEAARPWPAKFETVIFQSSFHHCIEFDELLAMLVTNVLEQRGRILFLSEPVLQGLPFPWGIRYDGEALWAVMCNGWLELGFEESFFIQLLFRHGLLASRVPEIPGLVGDGWCATRGEDGIAFAKLALPAPYDAGFHPVNGDPAWGRFCRAAARLPGHGTAACVLTVKNYAPIPLRAEFQGQGTAAILLDPEQQTQVQIGTGGSDISIRSDVFVPDALVGNGDVRVLGVAIIDARWTFLPAEMRL